MSVQRAATLAQSDQTAVAVNRSSNIVWTGKAAYRKIHWKVKADDQDAAVVHLLMILPEYQGDGAATVALDEIIKLAADKKKKAVRLDAIGTNVPAQKLYEKYGFVNCGTAQEYYESTGETEFVFYEYVLVE